MVDISKLSELGKSKEAPSEDGGINVMDAIKGVTELINSAKGLKKSAQGLVSSPQTQAPSKPAPVQVEAVKAKEEKYLEIPKPEKIRSKNLTMPKKSNKEQLEGYFNKILALMDMGAMFYGDIPISEFKQKLEYDKEKILLMISKVM